MRIRAIRKAKGLTQHVLAKRCGISPALLGQIERGHKNFRLQTLLPVAKGLETTVAELFIGIA
jgi:transcriptional regulator with XRE-family HTH domain